MRHANVAFFIPNLGCVHRCSFCDQRQISGTQHAPDPAWVAASCAAALEQLGADAENAQIAFFGGSFTAIDRNYMLSLLQAVQPYVGPGKFRGIRISTRPDAIDDERLALLRQYRVQTVELGAQSMCDEVLSANGRGHNAQSVRAAAWLLKNSGFELGLQMMTGLYLDTSERSLQTARELSELQPDCVRIYPTVVLPHTGLAELCRRGVYRPPDVMEAAEVAAQLMLFFEERGIRVIRVGLHASAELEKQALAGAYHPAFRELCESRIYFKKIVQELDERNLPRGAILILVAPGQVSKAVGQHRSNLQQLAAMGYPARVRADGALCLRELRVQADLDQ